MAVHPQEPDTSPVMSVHTALYTYAHIYLCSINLLFFVCVWNLRHLKRMSW